MKSEEIFKLVGTHNLYKVPQKPACREYKYFDYLEILPFTITTISLHTGKVLPPFVAFNAQLFPKERRRQ